MKTCRCFCLVLLACLQLPAAARGAEPPARILAVTVTTGYRHGSINTAEPVLEQLGRESGLFHVDFLRMPPNRPAQPRRPRRGRDTSDEQWAAIEAEYKQA